MGYKHLERQTLISMFHLYFSGCNFICGLLMETAKKINSGYEGKASHCPHSECHNRT